MNLAVAFSEAFTRLLQNRPAVAMLAAVAIIAAIAYTVRRTRRWLQ